MKGSYLLFPLCTGLAACSTPPADMAHTYELADLQSRYQEAYNLLCPADQVARTYDEYSDRGKPSPLQAASDKVVSVEVVSTVREGEDAWVNLMVFAPDYGSAWEALTDRYKADHSVIEAMDKADAEIARRIEAGEFSMREIPAKLHLKPHGDGWCVYRNFQGSDQANALRNEAEALQEAGDFEAAIAKCKEAKAAAPEEMGGYLLEVMDACVSGAEKAAEQKRRFDEYLPLLSIREVKKAKACRSCAYKVTGEVKNGGDEMIWNLDLTIYGLDPDGKPVFDKNAMVVACSLDAASLAVYGDLELREPLKPNYSRSFDTYLPDPPPSDWTGELKIEVASFALEKPSYCH